jgi:adenosylhomocysteine nucleosidase
MFSLWPDATPSASRRNPQCLATTTPKLTGGTGVSGDLFVAADSARAFLADQFEARIVDMESAAAAQVAYLNGIPFVAVRAISDQAGGDALVQITGSVERAARAAGAAVLEMVRRMPRAE